ncbi:MAG: OmpW family outer membrane protein [Pseudomonadota bacterium]
MKILHNPIPKLVFLTVLSAAFGSLAPEARAEDAARWELKTGIGVIDFDHPLVLGSQGDDRVFVSGNAGLATQFGIAYRASDLISYELSLAHARLPDVKRDIDDSTEELTDGPRYLPITAGMNFHLGSSEKFDFYVGPRLAFIDMQDIDVTLDDEAATFKVDNEYGWGIATGFSYRFGHRWSLTADATYIDVDLDIARRDTEDRVESGFDPLTFSLGASYRF